MKRRWVFSSQAVPSPGHGVSTQPVGYVQPSLCRDDGQAGVKGDTATQEKQLKQKVAMSIAQAPAKNLLMQGFMMYMTGSGVSIISIMIVGMSLLSSIKAIAACNKPFERLNDGTVDLLLPKLIYVGINSLFLAMGLWKCGKMGLLPTTSADWLSYLVRKEIIEHSGEVSWI